MPAAFVDLKNLQETSAQLGLSLFNGAGGRALQIDRSAGTTIVAAGPAELAYDLPQHFPRAAMRQDGAHRQDELVLVDTGADRPIDLLKANEKIDDFRRQLGLGKLVDPANDQPIVNKRALERLQDALEIVLRQPGIADSGQKVLVGERVQVEQGTVVNGAGLARVAVKLGFNPVEHAGRHP